MQGWFEELERDHDEQVALLDRVEVAIETLRLAEARHAVARLEQKLARHFAWEEEHVHGTIAGRLLPHERRAVDAVEQEHDELTDGFARLRYAVRGVLPSSELGKALAFVRAFRDHTLREQAIFSAIHDRIGAAGPVAQSG